MRARGPRLRGPRVRAARARLRHVRRLRGQLVVAGHRRAEVRHLQLRGMWVGGTGTWARLFIMRFNSSK